MVGSAKNKIQVEIRDCRVPGGRKGCYTLAMVIRVKPSLSDFWLEWKEGVSHVDTQGKNILCKENTIQRPEVHLSEIDAEFYWICLLYDHMTFLLWSTNRMNYITEFPHIELSSHLWYDPNIVYGLFVVVCQTGFIKILYTFLYILSDCLEYH